MLDLEKITPGSLYVDIEEDRIYRSVLYKGKYKIFYVYWDAKDGLYCDERAETIDKFLKGNKPIESVAVFSQTIKKGLDKYKEINHGLL